MLGIFEMLLVKGSLCFAMLRTVVVLGIGNICHSSLEEDLSVLISTLDLLNNLLRNSKAVREVGPESNSSCPILFLFLHFLSNFFKIFHSYFRLTFPSS